MTEQAGKRKTSANNCKFRIRVMKKVERPFQKYFYLRLKGNDRIRGTRSPDRNRVYSYQAFVS